MIFTQIAMLGHDAAHRQIFRSGRWNDWTTLVISNLLVGHELRLVAAQAHSASREPEQDRLRSGYRTPCHLVHPGSGGSARVHRRGPIGWLMAHQGMLFFPILLLEGLSLHASSVRRVLRSRAAPAPAAWRSPS